MSVMDQKDVECGGFVFVHNFDSGNLGLVEQVSSEDIEPSPNAITNILEKPDYEFNIWTRPDCAGTEFENGNRTWFYFGVRCAPPQVLVKLNIVNLNRQGKMYSQGMAPVTKTLPGKNVWERVKDRPTYFTLDNIFTMSFKYKTPENANATSYFAFTYPYTYTELQNNLASVEAKIAKMPVVNENDIYYCRETVCYSLEGRRMDLLTISSRHGITDVREDKLKNLFPDTKQKRPFRFMNKKVIFVSARVHPGETPSSFVINGLINLLIHPTDPVAVALRRLYVFKLIPFLNPDGVARGHYRTDTRGVNLNRVYLNPSLEHHPTIYAARALIRYYHYGFEKEDNFDEIDTAGLLPPPCEEDNSSNIFTLPYQDTKGYSSNTKRKKVSPKEIVNNNNNIARSMPQQKSRSAPPINNNNNNKMRQPLSSKAVITSNNNMPSTSQHMQQHKLKVDSEDDTTSSVIITSATLADQVEDLNLNELQQSMDGFNRSLMDDECAVDHIIRPPVANKISENSTKLRPPPMLEVITDDDDDEDSASCGPKPFSFGVCNTISKRRPSNDAVRNGGISVSNTLKFSQTWCASCMKTVNNLESRMPGISSIVPSRYKNSASSSNWNTGRCINCGSSLKAQSDKGRSIDVLPVHLPPGSHLHRDNNKNYLNPTRASSSTSSKNSKMPSKIIPLKARGAAADKESGLNLYIDLHGHASKKGIFMYGNHFEDLDSVVECMLLPRIMSLNNMHFHFSSCNFTERNMYLRDRRDGMSREGSGRVAVLKATGLTRSYTLECNYNTGKFVNHLPPVGKDLLLSSANNPPLTPPKYTVQLFEEVGKSLGSSILDLTAQHPTSRIPNSEHRSLHGIKEWLRTQQKTQPAQASSACPSTSTHTQRHRTRDPTERKENLLTDLPPVRPNTTSRLRTAKFLARAKVLADQQFANKSQRNLSLISIKKPVVSKHSRAFKAPLRSKSPTRRMLLGMKQKHSEDGEPTKESIKSLKESNKTKLKTFDGGKSKTEFKQKDLPKSKLEASSAKKAKLRNKDALYQKQPPTPYVSKPVTKRLKITQFLKYSDNSKEKYRVRKNSRSSSKSRSPLVGGPESWDGSSDLQTHKFI